PDGERLAYSVVTNRSNIWREKEPVTGAVSSRAAELVTTDQESIESFWISRDREWLVFDSDRSGTQQIFRRRLAGGEVQQITHGVSPAFSVSLSPDGKQVGYHSIVNGLRRVFVASSEGGDQPVQVSPGQFQDERNPQWSPDGERLAWSAIQDGVSRAQVVTRAARGWSAPREVASPGAAVGSTWGDTARLLAIDTVNLRLIGVSTDSSSSPPRVLFQATAATPKGLAAPVASTDFRMLYFANRQGIWVMPIKGGALRELVRFDDPLHPHATNARSVSGSAGFVYFTLQSPQSNIWIARVTGLTR
ncbi:MAG TPA: hypothetical protein VLD58_07905, partial [Gemmatimonadales bacterium]|nr:hypothetical protein [Gemmatimonadales bacterium]